MAFCCQMDNTVDMVLPHQLQHLLEIADVCPYKRVIRFILNIFQVCQITSVCQFVKIDNVIIRIFIHKQTHHVASDEACTTRNKYIPFKFHCSVLLFG